MIGTMLMFCTPPATTRSIVPDITAWAANCTACWALPHCRSIVTPGTCCGRPAASQHVLAMQNACGPTEADVAEHDVVDLVGVDAGALDEGGDAVGAEVGGMDGGEAAAAATDR